MVVSADLSAGSDITTTPDERLPMQDRHSRGTCFLLAASDYSCTADLTLRKSGVRSTANKVSFDHLSMPVHPIILVFVFLNWS